MPADDYSAAVSGGLKLKGVDSTSKVSKHRKKKPKPETDPSSSEKPKDGTSIEKEDLDPENASTDDINANLEETTPSSGERVEDATPTPPPPPPRAGKTEAELRHEERRRKRLDERIKREGTKTHKERVEELNRYLSNLSEHHDMPRIGPG